MFVKIRVHNLFSLNLIVQFITCFLCVSLDATTCSEFNMVRNNLPNSSLNHIQIKLFFKLHLLIALQFAQFMKQCSNLYVFEIWYFIYLDHIHSHHSFSSYFSFSFLDLIIICSISVRNAFSFKNNSLYDKSFISKLFTIKSIDLLRYLQYCSIKIEY